MVEQCQVHDSLTLSKNIDRVVRVTEQMYVAATYQLDKETGLKSGSLVSF